MAKTGVFDWLRQRRDWLIVAMIVVIVVQTLLNFRFPNLDTQAVLRAAKPLPSVDRAYISEYRKVGWGGNALLQVRFRTPQSSRDVFAVSTPTQAVFLRDDGLEGDTKAGDGTFSAIVHADLAAFRAREARIRVLPANRRVPLGYSKRLARRSEIQRPTPTVLTAGFSFEGDSSEAIEIPSDEETGDVNAETSLLIRDHSVWSPMLARDPCAASATDSMGEWTFGHLMSTMAQRSGASDASAFVEDWLNTWTTVQSPNSEVVAPRRRMPSVIRDWKKLGGGTGTLNLAVSPFRLLAVVNRLNLRDPSVPGDAGEIRFVFGLVNWDLLSTPQTCAEDEFIAILEYGVHAEDSAGVYCWAQKWYELKNESFPAGSATAPYRNALTNLTQPITSGTPANISCSIDGQNRSFNIESDIKQVRTIDFTLMDRAIDPITWQFREFRIADKKLAAAPLKRTPRLSFVKGPALQNFIIDNEASILDDTYDIPLRYCGEDFLAGVADFDKSNPQSGIWPAVPGHNEARDVFALNTCNGCHLNTGIVSQFFHIPPRAQDVDSIPSPFLRRVMDGRRADLNGLLKAGLFTQLYVKKPKSVH